jgi:hypothetical protein
LPSTDDTRSRRFTDAFALVTIALVAFPDVGSHVFTYWPFVVATWLAAVFRAPGAPASHTTTGLVMGVLSTKAA